MAYINLDQKPSPEQYSIIGIHINPLEAEMSSKYSNADATYTEIIGKTINGTSVERHIWYKRTIPNRVSEKPIEQGGLARKLDAA